MTSKSRSELLEDRLERLAALVAQEAHVSIWAADRDFRIVFWNKGAEHLYGISRKDALGKNYLELFVDEAERDQSAKDCRKIIDTDFRQYNCLAYDQDEDGNRLDMLTNCFRIVDPDTGEAYQAEVGVDIADLKLRMDEHHTLREVGIERLAAQRQTLEQRHELLGAKIDLLKMEANKHYVIRKAELDSWKSGRSAHDAQVILPVYADKLKRLEAAYRADVNTLEDLEAQARLCSDPEELRRMADRCTTVGQNLHVIRGGIEDDTDDRE